MDISDAVNDLAKDAKGMSKQQLAAAIQDLINTTAEQTAGNIYRGTDAAEQSDAGPVAWRFKPPFEIYNGYMDIADAAGHICTAESPEIATQLLTILNAAYTAPPRPDVSGLIEAAEWLTEHAKKLRGRIGADNLSHLVANEIDYSAAYLRARAADRSGK